MALEASEAWRRLIKQNNDLTVKCWAGIKKISGRVLALEALTLGGVITLVSHLSFPQNLLRITDCRAWVKMPEGKTIPKTYYYYYYFLNTHYEALSCFIHDSLKISHFKWIKIKTCYFLITSRPPAGGEQFWTNTRTYQKTRSAISHNNVFDGALLRHACRPKGYIRQNSEVSGALLGLNSQNGENGMGR